MRKRIQKYRNSGVLTGGSNLTPPLPQPTSLVSMIQQPQIPTQLELPDTVRQWNKNQSSNIRRSYARQNNLNKGFGLAGSIADVAGSLIPQTEQSALTTGLNQGYDAAANAVSAIPGVGTIIGGAMKVGGMLSDGLTALGVGTDQMTTADKILDSKFLKLTPVGLINSIGAKKADTITKDNEAFEQVGSSYGGTQATVDDALTKSGKKYGLFSGGARNKANKQIHNAQMQQVKMGNIADEAQMAFAASNNPLLGLGTQLQLNGGYQQNTVRAGKSGLKMDKDFAKRVVKLSEGKKSKVQKIQEEIRMEEVAGFKMEEQLM